MEKGIPKRCEMEEAKSEVVFLDDDPLQSLESHRGLSKSIALRYNKSFILYNSS